MAASAEKVAYFRTILESNLSDTFKGDASEGEKLRASVQSTQEKIKALSAANRALVGTSDEVKAAKEGLRARIDALRVSVSKEQLALIKQGTTYELLTSKIKKNEQAQKDAQARALSAVGGPLAEISAKLDTFRAITENSSGPLGLLKVGIIGVTAAMLALTAAAAAGAVAFGKWVLEGASAERSLQLVRKAMAGTEQNAANLGTQVDLLASKVDAPKDKINALGVELLRTRLSGQAIVDTLNTVAQTSAAVGDATGKAIQEMITRGQRWNTFRLSPLELQGTGIQFGDVAKQLAMDMNIGIRDASLALFQGRVRIEQGAHALRQVVENQFGDINAEKLTTLDGITQTWHKHLATLTKDVDWRPFGKGLGEILKGFDASTVSGRGFKLVIDGLGKVMADAFVKSVPQIRLWITDLSTAAIKATTWAIKVKDAWSGKFIDERTKQDVEELKFGIMVLKDVAIGAAIGIGASWAVAFWPLTLAAVAVHSWKVAFEEFGKTDWSYLGHHIVDGFVSGIKSGIAKIREAVQYTVDVVKSTFSGNKGIDSHSPSKWFAHKADDSIDGYAEQLERRSGEVEGAIVGMLPQSTGGGMASSGSGGGLTINVGGVTIQVMGGGAGAAKEIRAVVSSPSFLEQLTHAFEHAAQAAGIPAQSAVVP